jgi:hypothetical protein
MFDYNLRQNITLIGISYKNIVAERSPNMSDMILTQHSTITIVRW